MVSTCVALSQVHALEISDQSSFRVGVITGVISGEGTTHLKELLKHQGYPHDIIHTGNGASELGAYSLLIIQESGLAIVGENKSRAILDLATQRVGLLWIGPGISAFSEGALAGVFGVRVRSEGPAASLGVVSTISGLRQTRILSEQVTEVEAVTASIEGYFLDKDARRVFPSQCYLRRKSGGVSYLFGYDVSNWWNADPENPWSRPSLLECAIRFALSGTVSVMMRPYPQNFDSLFICRIEDVDPLHTGSEWLSRAHAYLQEYKARRVPLSVALTPVYLDPASGTQVRLDADSAKPVRDWLQAVISSRGTIVLHGYTHQNGNEKTGVGTEFVVNEEWMSYEEQMRRISLGKNIVEESLKKTIQAFEGPHYKINEDTLRALDMLGMRYIFDDVSTPFFVFNSLNEDATESYLIRIPETLSYIPLESVSGLEEKMKAWVDQLREFGGILLLYNHLYDDAASTIGIRIMEYILANGPAWTPNISEMGDFVFQRAKSLSGFTVTTGSTITVKLGACAVKGLTLAVNSGKRIGWVQLNGKDWPVFAENYVMLPELIEQSNTITISFEQRVSQHLPSMLLGLGIAVFTASIVFRFSRKVFGEQ
jgi:hypothetical protein